MPEIETQPQTSARSREQEKAWTKAWRDYHANSFTGKPSKAHGKARRRRANGR